MNKRVLGIDISDVSTNLVYYTEDEALRFPTSICRQKQGEEWYIGEDAYARALSGQGVITDKLLSLSMRNGTATLNNVKYRGIELLRQFLKIAIDISVERFKNGYPDEIVVSIPEIRQDIVNNLTECFLLLGYAKSHIHIISRCESFIYYVMSQSHDVWNNQVGLFSLSDVSLTYYELRVHRNAKTMTVYAESEDMDEGFNLEILKTASGARLADKILTSCAERLLNKKLFSSIMLTGNGFRDMSWASEFTKTVCTRRKVFADEDLFAKGACFRGVDFASEKPVFNFICICDGRLDTSVTINITKNNKELAFPLANAGDTWYTTRHEMRLIPDGISELELTVSPIDIKKRRTVKIPLDFLPKRPAKTLRIDMTAEFTDGRTMLIDIRDAGFGEIYPAGDAHLQKEVSLWD